MEPRYDETSGHLIIEWMESKKNESPKHHYYNKLPLKLHFHPKQKDKLIRAYFQGSLPAWIKRYAEIHRFEVQQVTHLGETGWWISKWRGFEENPFSSPTIKGAVRQFCKHIPFVCEDLKEKVKDNLAIIERNLQIAPTAFESYGLYFSQEVVEKKQGCLLLEEGVIPERDTDESDEDYRNKIESTGKLAELVWELTIPLPGSELTEEELLMEIGIEEEIAEEVMFNEEIIDLGEVLIQSDEEIIEITEEIEEIEDNTEVIILEEDYESEIVVEGVISSNEQLEELVIGESDDTTTHELFSEEIMIDEPISKEQVEETQEENALEIENQKAAPIEVLENNSKELESVPSKEEKVFEEPVIIKKNDKNSKALAGQMLLF